MGKITPLTKGQMKFISEVAAAEAIKAVELEHKKKKKVKKDWRLRNTKLLLANYRILLEHCQGIIPMLEDYEDVIFNPEDLNLSSLMKSKAKTKRMVDYFEAMIERYESFCNKQGVASKQRFTIIKGIYLQEKKMTLEDLAELYNKDVRTIQRYQQKAIKELSIVLFGVDSLEDLENVVFLS
ncbi:MAG: hypothetical protein RR936_06825 [Carnobacterium sp.]|uniref:hypothetical protein n=1 Tax=Carnobacterium sp. TaxID=48221 RepID=UPI002FCB68D7